jgi:hypothetical protein
MIRISWLGISAAGPKYKSLTDRAKSSLAPRASAEAIVFALFAVALGFTAAQAFRRGAAISWPVLTLAAYFLLMVASSITRVRELRRT